MLFFSPIYKQFYISYMVVFFRLPKVTLRFSVNWHCSWAFLQRAYIVCILTVLVFDELG